jgi:hypothetical protein
MRRAQAILVVLALLSLPVAPLAWGMTCDSNAQPMMYCPMHYSHSAFGKQMLCQCQGKAPQRTLDFAMVAPIPPAAASARVEIVPPVSQRDGFAALSQRIASGFRSAPFEPPRA